MGPQWADRDEIEILLNEILRNFPWGKVPRETFGYLQDFPREIGSAVNLINQGLIQPPPSLSPDADLASKEEEKWVYQFVKRQFPRDMLLRRRVLGIIEEGREVPWILPSLFSRWSKRNNRVVVATRWETLFGSQLKEVSFNEQNFPLPQNRVSGTVHEIALEIAMNGPRIEQKIYDLGLLPCDIGSGGVYIMQNPAAQRDKTILVLAKWQSPKYRVTYVPLFGRDGTRNAVSLRPFESKFAAGCAVLCEEAPKK